MLWDIFIIRIKVILSKPKYETDINDIKSHIFLVRLTQVSGPQVRFHHQSH